MVEALRAVIEETRTGQQQAGSATVPRSRLEDASYTLCVLTGRRHAHTRRSGWRRNCSRPTGSRRREVRPRPGRPARPPVVGQ
ncbi:DUF5133 domain-containing protein [Streptomyces sp. NPDC051578]|uniref:DUF5133 domain-containing protein n=1 Tax=Streptomyces sp. NPDC051578 TaxID=3365662 RepID=UPI0037959C2C